MPVINPATVALGAKVAKGGFDTARNTVSGLTGYDFVGLISRIVVFYVVALAIAKVMELIVFSSDGISKVANMFGIPLPSNIPEPIRKLFVEGYNVGGYNIKYWEFVKVASVVIVVMEFLQYNQEQKQLGLKPAPTTLGVFFLIISALALISIPQIYQMIKEKGIVTAFTRTQTGDFGSRDVFGRR